MGGRSSEFARLYAVDGLELFEKLPTRQGEGVHRVIIPRNHIARFSFRVYNFTFGPNSGYLVCVWDRSRDLARFYAKDGLGSFENLPAMQGEGVHRVLLPRNHIAHFFLRVYNYHWAKFGLLGMCWG